MTTVAVRDAAKERAWRTFKQQFPIDLAVFIIPLLIDMLASTSVWGTAQYWITIGVSVGKTILGILLAYVMRIKNPPKEEITN